MIANSVIMFISAAAGYFCAAWVAHWWSMRELNRVLPEYVELKPNIRGEFSMHEDDLSKLIED